MEIFNTTSQGILAKLLAAENITVHVGAYKTAMFDVKNRMLFLPTWNVDDKNISDLLVGHEVGHALFTPMEQFAEFEQRLPKGTPRSILNVIEDVRIERLIQNKYPGLINRFKEGYRLMKERDFFQIAGVDVSKLNIADRINLKAKLRDQIDVPFTPEEQKIFDAADAAETPSDVVDVCIDLWNLLKDQMKPAEQSPGNAGEKGKEQTFDLESEDSEQVLDQGTVGDDESDDGDGSESESESDSNTTKGDEKISDSGEKVPDEESSEDKSEDLGDGTDLNENKKDFKGEDQKTDETPEEKTESTHDQKGGNAPPEEDQDLIEKIAKELESKTEQELDKNIDTLHHDYKTELPVLPPSKEQLDNFVSWKQVFESRRSNERYEEFLKDTETFKKFVDWKKDTLKNIQYLVTAFERRKAAFQYSRAQTSDTGELDLKKLTEYKFTDQIFASVTRLADAKNHGMQFLVDFSASMDRQINEVTEHLLNLCMFCNAVKIPFQVFTFTTKYDSNEGQSTRTIQLSQHMTLMVEILSSEMSAKDFDMALRYYHYQMSRTVYWRNTLPMSCKYDVLGGTPLNNALVAMHEYVKRFRAKHQNVQKHSVIILTDGQSAHTQYGMDYTGSSELNLTSPSHYRYKSVVLNGRKILLTSLQSEYTELVHNLRVTTGSTVIGFFISPSMKEIKKTGIAAHMWNRNEGYKNCKCSLPWSLASRLFEELWKKSRRQKMALIPGGFGYDAYFILDIRGNEVQNNDEEFETKEDYSSKDLSKSTVNSLAKEFSKFHKSKKESRFLLDKFAQLIA